MMNYLMEKLKSSTGIICLESMRMNMDDWAEVFAHAMGYCRPVHILKW
jgi:hypothetical protein